MSDEVLEGVCCAYCEHFEQNECPVKTASPWSKWQAFCFKYEPGSHEDALSFKDAVLMMPEDYRCEVQTKMANGEFENVWTENDKPRVFESTLDAWKEVDEHIASCKESGIECDITDFMIVEVTEAVDTPANSEQEEREDGTDG